VLERGQWSPASFVRDKVATQSIIILEKGGQAHFESLSPLRWLHQVKLSIRTGRWRSPNVAAFDF
jgi:hypothetical protein